MRANVGENCVLPQITANAKNGRSQIAPTVRTRISDETKTGVLVSVISRNGAVSEITPHINAEFFFKLYKPLCDILYLFLSRRILIEILAK